MHPRGFRSRLAILVAVFVSWSLFAASTGSANSTTAAPQMIHVAGLEVAAWLPNRDTQGRWPIIIFSHGFHGCNTQSAFLMGALAEAGYVVFAPNHHDAACGNPRGWLAPPDAPFRDPTKWSDATYIDRDRDIENLLNSLARDARYDSPSFDWQHVGLVGHSLGGYTVLGVGGAWESWKDTRVKAVLALSPYSAPFIQRQTLGDLDAPVMYQGGTRDVGITPFLNKGNGAYDQSPAPKYFVEFDGAGHLAWTDLRGTFHAAIVEYSRAFLDRYLKGRAFPRGLVEPHQGVSTVRIKE